jgi:DNA-binding PadR family transcriptional regulator
VPFWELLNSPVESGVYRHFDIIYNVTYMKPFPFGSILGEFEQLVLLALLRLGNGAFGAAIHREITTRTGRDIPAGAVYVTLERLEAKRMVVSYVGTPTAQRGGRRRKHYLLDTAGQRALVRAYRSFAAMTAGIQPELEDMAVRLWPGASAAKPTSRHGGW